MKKYFQVVNYNPCLLLWSVSVRILLADRSRQSCIILASSAAAYRRFVGVEELKKSMEFSIPSKLLLIDISSDTLLSVNFTRDPPIGQNNPNVSIEDGRNFSVPSVIPSEQNRIFLLVLLHVSIFVPFLCKFLLESSVGLQE